MGALLSAILLACTGGDDTGVATLPPADSGGRLIEDTGRFPFDTSDSGASDQAPSHVLTVTQSGSWLLGGPTADPTSVTGTLEVIELLDGDEEEPACEWTWALVGTRAEVDCDGCAFTFTVEHTAVTAEGECASPELPNDGDVRTLGYAEAEASIWWDYGGTGVWVYLYDTEPRETADELLFSWETTLGTTVEDDE